MTEWAHEEKLKAFDIHKLARTMAEKAPSVWNMLDILFSPNEHLKVRREKTREMGRSLATRTAYHENPDGDTDMTDLALLSTSAEGAESEDKSLAGEREERYRLLVSETKSGHVTETYHILIVLSEMLSA